MGHHHQLDCHGDAAASIHHQQQQQLLMATERNHNNNSSNTSDETEVPQQRPVRRTTPMFHPPQTQQQTRYKYIPNHTTLPCVEEHTTQEQGATKNRQSYLSDGYPVRLPHPAEELIVSHQGDFPATIPSFHHLQHTGFPTSSPTSSHPNSPQQYTPAQQENSEFFFCKKGYFFK